MNRTALSAVLAIVLTSSAWSQQAQMYDGRPKITVTGEALVNVKPDKIVITFGIETWDKEIALAKQKNDDVMQGTVSALKALGIPEKEMQTDHLSIEPRWKDYQKRDFIGYFVRNTLVVTLNQIDKVEGVVTKALQAGVSHIHGVNFQTTEFKKYREQARELALTAAKEKAEKMAAVLDQSVGPPIQINENAMRSPWWYYSSWGGRGSHAMSQVNVQVDRGSTGEITESIALGKLGIRAKVTVTFLLKD